MDTDTVFATLPSMKESTEDYIKDTFRVVLWYKSTPRGKEFWCSRCGGGYEIQKQQRIMEPAEQKMLWARHGYETECPACGRLGMMACIGRIKNPGRYFQSRWFLIVQPVSETEVWLRETEAWYRPGVSDVCPGATVQMQDWARYRLTPGQVERYGRSSYYGWREISDMSDYTKCRYPYGVAAFNRGSGTGMLMEGELSETFLRYHSFSHMRHFSGNLALYLSWYTLYPSIEMMAKAGYHGFVNDLVENRHKNGAVVDWTKTDPREAFHAPKAVLSELRKRCNLQQPRYLQEYHRQKKHEKDPLAALALIERYRPGYGLKTDILDFLRPSKTREIDLYRYFEKVRAENPGCGMNQPPPVVTTWQDYIRAAKAVGYDLTQRDVVMPKDLYGRHDAAVALKNEMFPRQVYTPSGNTTKITEALVEKFADRAPRLVKKFQKAGRSYFIRVPETPEEVIAEGQALHHCVGGYNYIRNHADGKNAILFLRRTEEPDTPYYTMEVSPEGKILQCEGCPSKDGSGLYGHIHRADLPEDAKAFLDEWEREHIPEEKKDKKEKSA